ncbi:transposase, partial [Limosilactobacillus fermentum]
MKTKPTKQRRESKSGSSPKCWCKLNSANLSFHKLK